MSINQTIESTTQKKPSVQHATEPEAIETRQQTKNKGFGDTMSTEYIL
jgi:hypothetical protein